MEELRQKHPPEETHIQEEEFLRLSHGKEGGHFEFVLIGGEIERGYLVGDDITPGDGAHKNRVFLCKEWPYKGDNCRTDPEVIQLRFNRIKGVRLLSADSGTGGRDGKRT